MWKTLIGRRMDIKAEDLQSLSEVFTQGKTFFKGMDDLQADIEGNKHQFLKKGATYAGIMALVMAFMIWKSKDQGGAAAQQGMAGH